MHCHEYLKVQLQLLLTQLKSEKWRQNCTEVGEKFEANWGRDWRQTLPAGFVSEQPFLMLALERLVAHNDVGDDSLAAALRAVSSWCAGDGRVAQFLSAPQDRVGHALEITPEVAVLFEDMTPVAREIESMIQNEVYCPQSVRLRRLLARLNNVTQGATSCVVIPAKTIPAAASLYTETDNRSDQRHKPYDVPVLVGHGLLKDQPEHE